MNFIKSRHIVAGRHNPPENVFRRNQSIDNLKRARSLNKLNAQKVRHTKNESVGVYDGIQLIRMQGKAQNLSSFDNRKDSRSMLRLTPRGNKQKKQLFNKYNSNLDISEVRDIKIVKDDNSETNKRGIVTVRKSQEDILLTDNNLMVSFLLCLL